jgi:transcription elongation GreA/GreB family factor
MLDLKPQIYRHCRDVINQKIQRLQAEIQSIEESSQEDTKSSAGDKYETARAMAHLETEKLAEQLNEANRAMRILSQIDPLQNTGVVQPGSLVKTDKGIFFISVPAGKLSLDDNDFFALSPESPMGQALLGKREGDTFHVRDQQGSIQSIA